MKQQETWRHVWSLREEGCFGRAGSFRWLPPWPACWTRRSSTWWACRQCWTMLERMKNARMIIRPGASAVEPASAWSEAQLGERRAIGQGGLGGQRLAGLDGKSRFRFAGLPRSLGSLRIAGTAHGRFVRLPPVTYCLFFTQRKYYV